MMNGMQLRFVTFLARGLAQPVRLDRERRAGVTLELGELALPADSQDTGTLMTGADEPARRLNPTPDGAGPHHALVHVDALSDDVLGWLAPEEIPYEWVPGPNSGKLADVRVVVTRAFPQCSELAVGIAEQGGQVLVAPCLATAPTSTPIAAQEALQDLPKLRGLILSSPAAVRTWFAAWHAAGHRERPARLAAIGPSTAQACRAHHCEPDFVAADPRSEGLVQQLEAAGELCHRWLHWRADEGRPVLRHAFEQAGGDLRIVEGYRTVRPTWPTALVDCLRSPAPSVKLDVLTLTSGKAARHLLQSLEEHAATDRLEHFEIVSIGPATTAALRASGIHPTATARSPSNAALVETVLDLTARASF
ncbi:MAG: uroporphyrinogen-III synthase [Myxococcales bacterium FL481]|nr:MAG: uroporphyrinogen-III synthase [Myxococcales bacterium FL481]